MGFEWGFKGYECVSRRMGTAVTTHLDDDAHEKVLERHRETGQSKSQIVNAKVQDGFKLESVIKEKQKLEAEIEAKNGRSPFGQFWLSLGQSFFVVGPVIAFISIMLRGPFTISGVGLMVVGLGLMLWGNMLKHKNDQPDLNNKAALKTTLGL